MRTAHEIDYLTSRTWKTYGLAVASGPQWYLISVWITLRDIPYPGTKYSGMIWDSQRYQETSVGFCRSTQIAHQAEPSQRGMMLSIANESGGTFGILLCKPEPAMCAFAGSTFPLYSSRVKSHKNKERPALALIL